MSANEVFDTETQTWVKTEGDAAGRTEVVVSGSVAGEELAIKARQPELLSAIPLGSEAATPVRQVGAVDVNVVGASSLSATITPSDSGIPVHVDIPRDDGRAWVTLGRGGEGGTDHLGTEQAPIAVQFAEGGAFYRGAADRDKADGPFAVRASNGTDFIDVALAAQLPASIGTKIASESLSCAPASDPSFYAVFDRIAPAASKYMATIFNTSAERKVVIQRIYRFNWKVSGTGTDTLDQYLTRITARTAGTAVTIRADDTTDTLSAGISADHSSTGVTESHLIKRFFASNETVDLSNTAPLNFLSVDERAQLIYERRAGTRGHTLRENEGISIRNVTNTTNGSVSYIFEFTDEAA